MTYRESGRKGISHPQEIGCFVFKTGYKLSEDGAQFESDGVGDPSPTNGMEGLGES